VHPFWWFYSKKTGKKAAKNYCSSEPKSGKLKPLDTGRMAPNK
jgi:hypothetical protein